MFLQKTGQKDNAYKLIETKMPRLALVSFIRPEVTVSTALFVFTNITDPHLCAVTRAPCHRVARSRCTHSPGSEIIQRSTPRPRSPSRKSTTNTSRCKTERRSLVSLHKPSFLGEIKSLLTFTFCIDSCFQCLSLFLLQFTAGRSISINRCCRHENHRAACVGNIRMESLRQPLKCSDAVIQLSF